MTISRSLKHEHLVTSNPIGGRNLNRAVVLNSIRSQQPISRAEIAKITRLSKSTVSSIVATLVAEDLVAEYPECNQEVGRNPINLQVKKGTHFIGAISINSVHTELAVVDIDGTIQSSKKIQTLAQHPSEFINDCMDELNLLKRYYHDQQFKGLGVSIAGTVNAQQLKVIHAPLLQWENVDLGKLIRDHSPHIGMVSIENDANASALGELVLGTQRIASANMMYLLIGDSIGAGIVIDNHILSGSSHTAGDFGHVTILEGGESCSCGNKGCWEAYASDRATICRYGKEKQLTPDQLSRVTITDIIDCAKNGDGVARAAVTNTAHYIGRGITELIRAFDPEVIVIGGSVTRAWEVVYPHIMATVSSKTYFGKHRNATILPTSLLGSPPLLGAAALSIRKIFTDYSVAM
jgi:predicted NBD/HSP70 family sugar kinase